MNSGYEKKLEKTFVRSEKVFSFALANQMW